MKDKVLYIVVIILCIVFLIWNVLGRRERITYEYNTEEYSRVCKEYNLNDKGLFYDESLDKYFITLGLKNNGGYSIDVKRINIDKKNNVSIIVKEKEPKAGDIVTMAFTCPTIELTFSEKPKSIVVSNTKGEKYK